MTIAIVKIPTGILISNQNRNYDDIKISCISLFYEITNRKLTIKKIVFKIHCFQLLKTLTPNSDLPTQYTHDVVTTL